MGPSFRPTTHRNNTLAKRGADSAPRLCPAKLSMSVNGCAWRPSVEACVCVSWAQLVRKDCPARPAVLTPSFWWDAVYDRVWVRVVSVCILQREAEGTSHRFSIISSAPSTEWSKVWLLSCFSVMIHGIHLPERALGFSALWAKCPCKCGSCVFVCLITRMHFSDTDVVNFPWQS